MDLLTYAMALKAIGRRTTAEVVDNLDSSETGKALSANQGRVLKKTLVNYVTPRMFGAHGDGVTDDTTAFMLAIATGEPVVVPQGTYLITSTLTLQNDLIGIGLPKIITNTNVDTLISVENKVNFAVRNLNIVSKQITTAIKLTNVRNSMFENIRIQWQQTACSWYRTAGRIHLKRAPFSLAQTAYLQKATTTI